MYGSLQPDFARREEEAYYILVLSALKDACQQRPAPGQTVNLHSKLFSSASPTASVSAQISARLTSGASIGLGVGSGVAAFAIVSLIALCLRMHRKRRGRSPAGRISKIMSTGQYM